MFENTTRVLLILAADVLDRARVMAGKATTALKLPVSLQIVLRVLIEEGLKRDGHPALLASIEGQARAVREKRRSARRPGAEGKWSPRQAGQEVQRPGHGRPDVEGGDRQVRGRRRQRRRVPRQRPAQRSLLA